MNNQVTAEFKPRHRFTVALTILLAIVAAFSGAVPALGEEKAGEESQGEYICPPCGHENEDKVYDKAGSCPVCHMKLVMKKEMTNVAILVFDGVQIIDYTGPYEVFGQGGKFNVYTVSETGETLTAAMGMSMNPSHSFETAPKPDILIVPGGNVHGPTGSAKTIEWVKSRTADADHVMSVCNGAFILARAGLLEGKKATTFYGLIDELREIAPNTEVVTDQRFVDNGKIITTAGLSSGIDGSLYLISKIRGQGSAQAVALHIEYQWDPESDFARAALADRRLPNMGKPDGAEVNVAFTTGTRDHWKIQYEVRSDLTLEELTTFAHEEMSKLEGWTRRDAQSASKANHSSWTFLDSDGSRWAGTMELDESKDATAPKLVTFAIERVNPKKAQALK